MVQKGGESHGIEKHAVRNIKLPPELRALTFARALVTSLPFAYLQEKVGYALFGVSSLFIIFLWRTPSMLAYSSAAPTPPCHI